MSDSYYASVASDRRGSGEDRSQKAGHLHAIPKGDDPDAPPNSVSISSPARQISESAFVSHSGTSTHT